MEKELVVNITYERDESFMYQTFAFVMENRKFLPYIYDSRFSLKEKIDLLIKQSNKQSQDYCFEERLHESDKIIIKYKIARQEYFKLRFKPSIVKIKYSICQTSCNNCAHKEERGGEIYCPIKKKFYKKEIKSCKVFKQNENT
jgi:hypothetical protein